jgi:hypothetical protein
VEALGDWNKAAAAYQEIRPYVEKEDRKPLLEMLASLECVARMKERASPNGVPYRFLPVLLTVSGEDGITLKGVAPLPPRDKSDHLKALSLQVTNAFAAGGCAPHATCQLTWKKAVPAVEDKELEATLRVTFATVPPRTYPSPPPELEALVQSIRTWRDAVHRCVVINASGSKEKQTVEQMLLTLVSNNRQVLGDAYERVKAVAIDAVDPMAVSAEISRAAGAKSPVGLAAFEQSWLELSLRRWGREATLDKPELDRAIMVLDRAFSALPRKHDFEASFRKSESYFSALSNGVQTQHITQEDTFWTDMLQPCFSNASVNVDARLKSGIVIDEIAGKGLALGAEAKPAPASAGAGGARAGSGNGKRVAFPVWSVAVGHEWDSQSVRPKSFLMEALKAVLMNVEAHSTGTWVTSLSITFASELPEPGQRWNNLQYAQVEGRVPCWLGKAPSAAGHSGSIAEANELRRKPAASSAGLRD